MSTSSPQALVGYSSLTIDIDSEGYTMINISPSDDPASIRNIVVAGETGVGKSSLINLIIEKECVATSNNILGVTRSTDHYDWINDNQTFCLWDTPGLNEGTQGAVSSRAAQHALHSLLSKLTREDGVHLLVICMRGLSSVPKSIKSTYDPIARIRNKFNSTIPIVAVITELEKRSSQPDIIPSMDTWWTNHVAVLTEYDMVFAVHACITTLSDDDYPELHGRRVLCQEPVRKLIVKGAMPRNIVIVGEIGAGKSSLVNLVLGSDRAFVQNNIPPVTTTAKYYNWEASGENFRLWDTPGLGESVDGIWSQKRTEAVDSLLADLSQTGGVHLIIVCIGGISKISAATRRTYGLIMRMRDQTGFMMPVAAIITEVEGWSTTEGSMKQWWTANLDALSHMSFSGHAWHHHSPRRLSSRGTWTPSVVPKACAQPHHDPFSPSSSRTAETSAHVVLRDLLSDQFS